MNDHDIKNGWEKINSYIEKNNIYLAFAAFEEAIKQSPDYEVGEQLSALQTSYRYMLSYMAQGMEDPQKEKIYNDLLKSLYDSNDTYCHNRMVQSSPSMYIARQKDFGNAAASLNMVYREYATELEHYKLYAEIPDEETDKNKVIELCRNMEKAETRLFNYVWTMFKPGQQECEQLAAIMKDAAVPMHTRILLLSAIFLNINTFFNERLILLLFDLLAFYRDDNEMSMRTMCCLFLSLLRHNHRAMLHDSITSRIDELKHDQHMTNALQLIVMQYVRSCNTDNLTKMVRDKLLPIMHASPSIIKAFKDRKINPDDISDIEGNPEWENFLEKSGLADKVKEINEMQMEGDDVFMGMFSQLKSFPFFNEIANWFLPFHDKHSAVALSPIANNRLMINIITNSRFLCDSDRFSFCLSISSIPEEQRNAMLEQFDAQNEMLDEIKSVAVAGNKATQKQIITNYMQDLYRFFKLYSRHSEFANPFEGNLLDFTILSDIICTTDNLLLIGEYYFKGNYYEPALPFFLKSIEGSEMRQPNVLQKIGFCYQRLRRYDKALEYYLRYDLFDGDNLWNIKHIAATYKSMENLAKAVEYYKKAEAMAPDDLSVCLNIGHCLLGLERVDEALKYYYKADYMGTPDDPKTLRPIAWCHFLQKNFEQSEKAYVKLINSQNKKSDDLLNLGHVKLAMGHVKEAIEAYHECVVMLRGLSPNTTNILFSNLLNPDRKYLEACGISPLDINLILDIINYKI